MRFWDSSALVPLFVEEPTSRGSRELLRADPRASVWTFTRLEVLVALCRKRREGALDERGLAAARARLERVGQTWVIFEDAPDLRQQADRLAVIHDLRTGDVLQLAAALIWCEGRARGRHFVASDDRSLAAAAAEGFTTIRPA